MHSKIEISWIYFQNCIYATYPIQSANSYVFGTVADKRTIPTCSGSIIKTSSQTTPRLKRSVTIRREKIISINRVGITEWIELAILVERVTGSSQNPYSKGYGFEP